MRKILIFVAALIMFGWGAGAGAVEMDVLGGVSIHGFISQGFLTSGEYNYLAHNSKTGSFEYNEMGINFSKQVTDKLRVGTQIFSRDLGDVANNKVTIDWAYGDYKWRDWLGIRAGRIKSPLGLFNETRDIDMLRTCIVLPQNFYPDLVRDVTIALNGVGLYGYVPLGAAGSLDYSGIAGAMTVDNESGVEKYLNSSFGGVAALNGDVDIDTALTGRIKWNTPLSGLALSVSALKFKANFPILVANIISTELEQDQFTWGTGVEYSWQNLALAFEYRTTDMDMTPSGGATTNKKAENYYLMASYRFTDWFELGSYYAIAYPNKEDKDGDSFKAMGLPDHRAWQKDLALSARFDINSNWTFKLEGHKVDGTSDVLAVDNADRSEGDWYYGAAKLTFSF